MRILSYNIDSGLSGFDELIKEIDRYSPDIVTLQEIGSESIGAPMRARYPTVNIRNQFLIANRFFGVSWILADEIQTAQVSSIQCSYIESLKLGMADLCCQISAKIEKVIRIVVLEISIQVIHREKLLDYWLEVFFLLQTPRE